MTTRQERIVSARNDLIALVREMAMQPGASVLLQSAVARLDHAEGQRLKEPPLNSRGLYIAAPAGQSGGTVRN